MSCAAIRRPGDQSGVMGRAGGARGQHRRHPGPGPVGHQGQVGLVLDLLAAGKGQGRARIAVEEEAGRLGQQLGVGCIPPVDRHVDLASRRPAGEPTHAPLLIGVGHHGLGLDIEIAEEQHATSSVDGSPSGDPTMRWTRAVTPQPSGQAGQTATGIPEPLTTAARASSPMRRLDAPLQPAAQVGQGGGGHRRPSPPPGRSGRTGRSTGGTVGRPSAVGAQQLGRGSGTRSTPPRRTERRPGSPTSAATPGSSRRSPR